MPQAYRTCRSSEKDWRKSEQRPSLSLTHIPPKPADGSYLYLAHKRTGGQGYQLCKKSRKDQRTYPSAYSNKKNAKYTHHEQYFNNIDEYLEWAKILNISSIGELNDAIIKSKPGELINLSESIQDYRLQQIAKSIQERKDDIKIILLSGPSSSGKTTSARKLSMYLKTFGLNPIPLSLDDYFLNRDETPFDICVHKGFQNILQSCLSE